MQRNNCLLLSGLLTSGSGTQPPCRARSSTSPDSRHCGRRATLRPAGSVSAISFGSASKQAVIRSSLRLISRSPAQTSTSRPTLIGRPRCVLASGSSKTTGCSTQQEASPVRILNLALTRFVLWILRGIAFRPFRHLQPLARSEPDPSSAEASSGSRRQPGCGSAPSISITHLTVRTQLHPCGPHLFFFLVLRRGRALPTSAPAT